MGGNHSRQAQAAVTVRFSVTVRQVLEGGTEVPVEEEVAAALAGTAEQFAGLGGVGGVSRISYQDRQWPETNGYSRGRAAICGG